MEEKLAIRQATLRIETALQDDKGRPFKGFSFLTDYTEPDTGKIGEQHQIDDYKITEAVFDTLVAKLRRELKERGIFVKESR